jgi:shikimate dehydrogenase
MGMTTDTVPFDVAALPETALVFDLVYVPPDTPLVRSAAARGLAVCNGIEMLVRQGEIAFERWTGIGSTADIMRAALEDLIPGSEIER